MAVIISLFNHKGGVGKTTITVNIARAFSQLGFRTLVVDADPQCNATAFYLPEEDVDSLLEASAETDKGDTIWSSISKSVRGKGDVRPIDAIDVGNGDDVWLMPGDIALALFEDRLAGAWKDCFSRDPTAIDLVSALYRGITATADHIEADVVLVDMGPSIGSLNRVLMLGSDYFVIPVACDLFSLRALRTVGGSLLSWMNDWNTISGLAANLEDVTLLPGKPTFSGYITQHFNIYRARATAPFEEWERKVAPRVAKDVVDPLKTANATLTANFSNKIGSIPAYHSLSPLSQKHGVPIGGLRGFEDVNSGYNDKIRDADALFKSIAKGIGVRVGVITP